VKRTWRLQQELYKLFHQWHIMILIVGIGFFVGWMISYICPSKYRAISEIYVALNPYRTYSDTTFLALTHPKYSNLDNYLFWQMSQLEEVVYLSAIVNESLNQLQQIDPYWKTITEENFREMLEVDWRAAGKWSFIVEHYDPEHAEQAAITWSDFASNTVKNAVIAAQETFMIDQELQSIEDKKIEAQLRIEKLNQTNKSILDWKKTTRDNDLDLAIDNNLKWEIINIITLAADFSPLWQDILNKQPSSEAALKYYNSWINQVSITIDNEIQALQEETTSLEQKDDQLSDHYKEVSYESLGLSPNLAIENVVNYNSELIRPTSTISLIGGGVSLFLWLFIKLIFVFNTEKKYDPK